MFTDKMKTSQTLFMKTFIVWVEVMRVRYNCCVLHTMAAFERVIEMTEMSTAIIRSVTLSAMTEDEFCKAMDACTQEMKNELATLQKAEKIETQKEPFILQKEARA